jgi:hypothetical protein
MAFDAMKVLETTDFGPPNHIAFISHEGGKPIVRTNRKESNF